MYEAGKTSGEKENRKRRYFDGRYDMKKRYAVLSEQVKLIGIKKEGRKLVDYYIVQPGCKMIYAFTKPYTKRAYDLCKSGISIKTLLCKKSKDTSVMGLIRYTAYMMPYFMEEYELIVVA